MSRVQRHGATGCRSSSGGRGGPTSGTRKRRRASRSPRPWATTNLLPPASHEPLLDVDAADGAGDDETLDLGGAFEDRVDLRVAVPALDRVLLDVAGAAKDLDRLLG